MILLPSFCSDTVDDRSIPIDVDGDHIMISDEEDGQEEEVEVVNAAGKRKLTSKVWKEMKKVKVHGQWKRSEERRVGKECRL